MAIEARRLHHVISGASSGLGAALALAWSGPARVLTLFGRDAARLEAVAGMCRRRGADVATVTCDITDAAAMERALLAADGRCPVDVVVANAGIGGAEVLSASAGEPGDLAHKVVTVNLLGTVNTIAPLQEVFIGKRKGRFVVIGSMAAFEGLADAPAYAASKAAVRIYGHSLRRRLAPHGVHVNVVSPGFITTPMSRSLPFALSYPWSADRAAGYILKGIERNRPEIVFPWQLRLGIAASRMLPVSLVDRIMAHARERLRLEP